MRSKWQLVSSIFQIVVGVLAIASFIIIGLNGENLTRWIVTLILAVAFVILGIIGVVDYKSNR